MAYAETQDVMKISPGSFTRILRDCLGVRKRCACWVPHNLSEEQKPRGLVHPHAKKIDGERSPHVWVIVTGDKTWVYQYEPKTKQQSEVWVFPDENPPVKFKRNRSASKQLIVCFFAKFGHVATIPLEDKKTITDDWYINRCLTEIFQACCKRHPRTGVRCLLLHHDNASMHTAAVTLDCLATNDIQLVTHSPFSPDLAPCE